ncbi:MFS-type transporter SLC18B1-like [Saccoglossus kowalevskii]|uniref:MFS-type transporter SLC18B1-like n=1 Tax=Saccoglossus kowalevskii TaxID=10224 RepID=A0ABM0GUY2_SACKO|nr:PREDICTED: MFS-type transporter SLC18B1-like [Saccoglossus kowalevskii]
MGTSTTQVGLIFGSYALTMFIFSPIFGKLIPIVGAKFLFLAGSFMGGGTCFIFGFLNRLAPGTQFVTFCFITRILEAIGAAASSTGAYSIIAKTFRQNITTAFGTIEIFCGLGLMIGPPVGGALYQAGGYTLPFVVWGLFSMGIVVVNYFIVPSEGDESHRSGSLIQLLKIPSIIMTSICVLCGFMGIGFLDPTLADHLSQFDLSATQIGLMFLANSGAYAVSAFFWGWLTDKYDIPKVLMIIGNIASIIGFIYIGPSPLLNIKSELWLVAFSLVMLGLSLAASVLPTFNEMLSSARLHGMEENISTYGIISGLFSSLFSLGNFLGPTVGSAMVSHIGFEWTSTCFSGMYAFVATTLILFCLWEYRCGTRRKINPAVSRQLNIQDDDEKKPLLA